MCLGSRECSELICGSFSLKFDFDEQHRVWTIDIAISPEDLRWTSDGGPGRIVSGKSEFTLEKLEEIFPWVEHFSSEEGHGTPMSEPMGFDEH